MYAYIDIIKPNESEATIITGIKVHDVESAKKAGHWLLGKGVQKAIITLGEKGVVLITPDYEEQFPDPEVNAVDTTGAGDIFSGCFLASLANGKAINDAIKSAIYAASLSTTKIGVIESIPETKDMEEFISQHSLVK